MRYTRTILLLLVRHALTPATGKKLTGWLPGISLSAEGRAQAASARDRLKDVPINAAYSSPLERCVETAEIIAAPHRMKVEVIEDLGEIKYGDWQGRTLASLYKSKAWVELRARPAEFRFPNGETIREAQLRGMSAIEALRPKHKGQIVSVCSHADMIRVVTAGYLGLPLDLYDRISIGPATVTAISLSGSVPRLLRLSDSGDYSELAAKAATTKKETSARKKK